MALSNLNGRYVGPSYPNRMLEDLIRFLTLLILLFIAALPWQSHRMVEQDDCYWYYVSPVLEAVRYELQ